MRSTRRKFFSEHKESKLKPILISLNDTQHHKEFMEDQFFLIFLVNRLGSVPLKSINSWLTRREDLFN